MLAPFTGVCAGALGAASVNGRTSLDAVSGSMDGLIIRVARKHAQMS